MSATPTPATVSAPSILTTQGARTLHPATAAQRSRADGSAQGFEASFLSVMLGQMFQGVEQPAPFGGGQAESAFRSFLTDAMAKSMAGRGGIGLAKTVSHEMLKLQGLT